MQVVTQTGCSPSARVIVQWLVIKWNLAVAIPQDLNELIAHAIEIDNYQQE